MKICYRAIHGGLASAKGCFKFVSVTYQVSNLRAVVHRGCPDDPLKIVADILALCESYC